MQCPDAEWEAWKTGTVWMDNILGKSPIPTFVIDAHCRIVHWNCACERLTGVRAFEIIGTNRHRDAFYTDRRELMADMIVRSRSKSDWSMRYGAEYGKSDLNEDGYEAKGFFPKFGTGGKWILFSAAPIKGADGKLLGAIETFQDITAQHLAEEALVASESRYRQLFGAINDSIFIFKGDVIQSCNQKALDLFGCPRNDLVGMEAKMLFPMHSVNGAFTEKEFARRLGLISQGKPQLFEWRFCRKDGTEFDGEVTLSRFHPADEPLVLAIVRDLTDRNQLAHALQARQEELDERSRHLENANQALKALMDNREIEKRAVEEDMLINLKRFVCPYLDALERSEMSSQARAYLDVVSTHLNNMVSRGSQTLFAKYLDLTQAEIRIADLIREGKRTKEIAVFLGLSPTSIKWHRRNIRQKLGLTHEKINLQAYLNTLPS